MDGNRRPPESDDIELPSRMDVVREFYYRWNMRFLVVVGLWPYSTAKVKLVQHIVVICALTGSAVCQAAVLFTAQITIDFVLTILPTLAIAMGSIVKYLTYWTQDVQLRQILDHITHDWNNIDSTAELSIIIKRAIKGQYYLKIFALFIYPAATVMMLVPLSSVILDMVAPLSEPRCLLGPVPFVCFFNCDDHRITALIIIESMILIVGTNFVATETTVIMCLQHLSGLFAITRFRIKEAFSQKQLGSLHSERNICKRLIRAIFMHQNSLIFAKRLNRTFLAPYFPLLGFGILTLTMNLYRISQNLLITYKTDDLLIAMFLSLAILGYMFYLNFVIQQVIDSYAEVFVESYNTDWYEAPLSMQKLLLFIMLKTVKPINFTIFNLYNPSIHGFSMLVQTSASYFMVLHSYQSQQT